jgi:thiamine transporter ThiT
VKKRRLSPASPLPSPLFFLTFPSRRYTLNPRRTRLDRGDSRKELNMEKRISTRTLTGVAIFTAIVVILQFLGAFVRFGPFSISLVLIPIVVGAALYGVWAGSWLGFVFGVVVLLSGDAGAFLAVNVLGTILTVLLKGTLCGLCAGLVYKALSKWQLPAVVAAAVTAPVVNTGVFLLGCLLFFMPTITAWGQAAGFENVGRYMILGLAGGNFLFELLFNIVLSPVVVRLIKIGKKENR